MKLLVNLKKHAQQDDTKVLRVKIDNVQHLLQEMKSKTNALVCLFWVIS